MSLELAQKYTDDAVHLYKEAQKKMDEYEGKEMPQDVLNQVDTLFAQGDAAKKRSNLEKQRVDAKAYEDLPNDLKRLDTPQVKNDEAKEEAAYEKIMEKYGLRRWQIKDARASLHSMSKAFEASRQKIIEKRPDLQQKALSGSAATSGSTITPDIFVAEFVNKLYLGSHLRAAGARIVPLNSDITRYPRMTTASGAASLIAELGTSTTTNATLGEVAFTARTFRAMQQASIELVADAEFDVLSEVILPDMAQMFAAAENSYFTLGSAGTQPEGIVFALKAATATTGVSIGSLSFTVASNYSFDHLLSVMHKVPPQYRNGPNTGWMMNDDLIKNYRAVKAVSGGTYLWEPSVQAGAPDRLFGRPVYYNQTMVVASAVTTVTTSPTCIPIIYGDFNYFWIGDRMGLDVVTANELYLETAQVGYFGFKRSDSHLMQAEAFAVALAT